MSKPKLPVEKLTSKVKGKPPAPVPVHVVDIGSKANPAYKISNTDMERERKWKAEDALRDIERAEGHKRDGKLMKDVKVLATEKIKSLNKVASGPKGYKGD